MGEFELRPSSIISVTLPDDKLKQLSANILMNRDPGRFVASRFKKVAYY